MEWLKLLWRRQRRSVGSDLALRVLHPVSDAVATVPTRGRPVYGHGDLGRPGDVLTGAEVPEGLYHQIANVDPAGLTAPGLADAPNRTYALDLAHANAVCLAWMHQGDVDLRTGTVDVTVWVHTALGWVRCSGAVAVTLNPRQELRVETGCRRIYVQLENAAGVAGNINLYAGGEA